MNIKNRQYEFMCLKYRITLLANLIPAAKDITLDDPDVSKGFYYTLYSIVDDINRLIGAEKL